jgi:hypothetical protein
MLFELMHLGPHVGSGVLIPEFRLGGRFGRSPLEAERRGQCFSQPRRPSPRVIHYIEQNGVVDGGGTPPASDVNSDGQALPDPPWYPPAGFKVLERLLDGQSPFWRAGLHALLALPVGRLWRIGKPFISLQCVNPAGFRPLKQSAAF